MFKIIPLLFLSILHAENSYSLAGMWSDSSSTSFANVYALFTQKGDRIHMSHYFEFNKHPFFEQGTGIRIGDTLKYHVDVVKQVPDWNSTSGEHVLVFQNDSTLVGTFTDNKGNTGPLVFKKRKN